MQKKRLIPAIFLLTSFIALFLSLVVLRDIRIRNPDIAKHDNEYLSYALKKKGYDYYNPSISVTYPQADYAPDDMLSLLPRIQEKYDFITGKYNDLDIISKKISQFESWPKKWSQILPQYRKLVLTRISKTTNDDEKQILGKQLSLNQEKIDQIVNMFVKNFDEKQRILSFSNTMFSEFDDILGNIGKTYNPEIIEYSLEQIVREKDYGIYELSSDEGIESSVILKNKDQLLDNELEINDNDKIFLKKPLVVLTSDANWQLEATEEGELSRYQYLKKVQIPNPGKKYFISIDSHADDPYIFELQCSYVQKKNLRSETLLSINLIPGQRNKKYNSLVIMPEERNYNDCRFAIISDKKIPKKTLSDLKPSASLFWEPELNVIKKANIPDRNPSVFSEKISSNRYLIIFTNTTLAEEKQILNELGFGWHTSLTKKINGSRAEYIITYWPADFFIKLFFILLSLFFITAYTSRADYVKIIRFVTVPFRFFVKITVSFFTKFRRIFLISFFLILVSDIFHFKNFSDLMLILIMFLWTGCTVGYRLESRIAFAFVLIFLIVCPILILFEMEKNAEQMAILAYIFLCLGTFQALAEIRLGTTNLISFEEVNKLLSRYWFYRAVKFFILKLKNLYLSIKKTVVDNLKKFINMHPKTFSDYLLNFVKISFIFFACTVIFFACLKSASYIHKSIKAGIKKKHRLSLNPRITKIEPQIVYYNTKIIVFGKGFELKNSNKFRLMSQYGEIPLGYGDWNIDRLYFTVPMHWKTGEVSIWMEKPINWDGETVVEKSNVMKIKLIPVSETFGPDDDAYFEQLKHLDKEVLKLNGY